MTEYVYHLIDCNTGEEVFASDDFRFLNPPAPNHRINDPVLKERYGSSVFVDRIEEEPAGVGITSVNVYIDSSDEVRSDDLVDPDQSYNRS